MFLKQEKPEMDDFEKKKKNFGSEGKILIIIFLTDTLAKMSQNIFAYSLVSEHSNNFFVILRKNLHFLAAFLSRRF